MKTIKDDTGIKLIISKTKDAEGYEVYLSGTADSYVDYKYMDTDYNKIGIIEEDGTSKRTVTITSYPAGTYKIKVRSYNSKKYGVTKYSEYSKEKKFELKEATPGYASSYDFSKAKQGDIVTFGAYEQDGDFTNGKEPIEWIVLRKTKKQVFVISKYILDCVPYNYTTGSFTWETCTVRKWLNEVFYTKAFNTVEQKMIKTTKLENFDNVKYKTNAGNDTKDKVFLLSQLDVINADYGFSDSYDSYDELRYTTPTDYANENPFYGYANTWWLRTPGYSSGSAALIQSNGKVDLKGHLIYGKTMVSDKRGIRPAMVIKLRSE